MGIRKKQKQKYGMQIGQPGSKYGISFERKVHDHAQDVGGAQSQMSMQHGGMQKVDSTDSFFIANPLALDNADLDHPTGDEQLYSLQPVTREGLEEFLEKYKEIVKQEKAPLYRPAPDKYSRLVDPYPHPDAAE